MLYQVGEKWVDVSAKVYQESILCHHVIDPWWISIYWTVNKIFNIPLNSSCWWMACALRGGEGAWGVTELVEVEEERNPDKITEWIDWLAVDACFPGMQIKLVHPDECQRSHWRTMKAIVMRHNLLSIWSPQHSSMWSMAANQELQEMLFLPVTVFRRGEIADVPIHIHWDGLRLKDDDDRWVRRHLVSHREPGAGQHYTAMTPKNTLGFFLVY